MELSQGVRSLVKWQYRMHGGFYTALWDAISRADTYHLDKLSLAFPDEVEAYRKYTSERGWWAKVLDAVKKNGGPPML